MKSYNYGCPPGGSAPAANYATAADGTVTVTGCTISDGTNAWISTVCAAACAVIATIGLRWVIVLVNRDLAALEAEDAAEATVAKAVAADVAESGATGTEEAKTVAAAAEHEIESNGGVDSHGKIAAEGEKPNRTPAMLQDMRRSKVWKALTYSSNVKIHDQIKQNRKLSEMHAEAEVFDRKTELSFKYLQVLTACSNSFAHGSNDVANAIGSMAAIYSIWQCTCAQSKAPVPIWMFVIGGVGLVIGLSTYGYKIMQALGVKMTKLTNSRGYCAELTAAIIVIISSRYGFPVSTTQVITGAITGIGLEEVISAKLRGDPRPANRFNWILLLKFFMGWVATLVVCGLVSAAFTAQGVYAPNYYVEHEIINESLVNAPPPPLYASLATYGK